MIFKKLSKQEISKRLSKRAIEIKNIDKLSLINGCYLYFISKYKGIEIIPDIEILSYEEALKENRYLETNFCQISQLVWMIGRTGQGDEWFIDRDNGRILFYDHNQGEYSKIDQFLRLNISFEEFLQMAFLYQDLENLFDKQVDINENQIESFIEEISSIDPDLYKSYPFKYF